tara:strand:+ start:302 stop:469 length:168 start_codon:yes stop_codon:yes gene_type:complete
MTSNFQEFIGMVGIVGSATFFITGFRWAIYKLGSIEPQIQQNITTQTDNAGVTQR